MTRTATFLDEISATLQDNILSFWLEKMCDPQGGFYGEMHFDGTLDKDAPRGVILNARIIWSFSAAYKCTGRKEYLLAATHARDYFQKYFQDHKWGGVYWSIDHGGKRLDTKKQLYAQAFAIYGLSEYYSVIPDDQALKMAVNLFKVVEKEFHDETFGGYKEALARDFSPLEDMSLSEHDINADKTMNSHLHLLEAYANLYKVYPDKLLETRVRELLDILLEKILDRETGHLRLYFSSDWTPARGALSYGHDIETSWLALEAASILHDADLVNKVRPLSLLMAKAGLEGWQEDGSMVYEKHPDDTLDTSREWWVQAEAVVGNLWLWKYHNCPEALERALQGWDFIKKHLVDRRGGEWWWSVDSQGRRISREKAGFWKCPYHNSRMCIQILTQI